jgi:SAM-dependent methyltransferase
METNLDIRAYNREAWNRQVKGGCEWTIPVTPEQTGAARQGQWSIVLTPTKPVPRDWFPADLHGVKTLCLACGGGQQGPILAAAGAQVTVFDNSPAQLGRDREVAERDHLDIETIEGDMADLSVFPDNTFDLIFHPVSNLFAPRLQPVWNEAYRVLKPGGSLLAGFTNPVWYIFDFDLMENEKRMEVRYSIPYSDLEQLPPKRLQEYLETNDPLEFGHSLEDQIGGQLKAGFALTGFYEDIQPWSVLAEHIPSYIATRALKI